MSNPALALSTPARVNEPELIARVLAGDRLAARALYDAHVGAVYRLAYRFTGEAELAHEVTQDTFVKALGHLDRFRGESALATWLHRITVSAALNAKRRVRRQRAREMPLDDAFHLSTDRGADADPILRDRLYSAIDALPEIYRTTLIMHDFEGYTHVEIAETLGVAVGTCKSRLSVARAQLRTALGDLVGR